jgi:hypothetical protein
MTARDVLVAAARAPWRVSGFTLQSAESARTVMGGDDGPVAWCGDRKGQDAAYADAIVAAVNAHEPARDALRAVLDAAERGSFGVDGGRGLQLARAALDLMERDG